MVACPGSEIFSRLFADDKKTRKDYNSPETSQQHRSMNKQLGNVFIPQMLHLRKFSLNGYILQLF
jgi:hypothetical protein